MDPSSLRNFKDFLQLYNRMTEMCFSRCVDNMNTRNLSENEINCVEDCSSKFVKFNNKLMQNFVSAQTEIVNKRVAEAEKQQLAEVEKQRVAEEEKQNLVETDRHQFETKDMPLTDSNKSVTQNEINNILVKS